jgi:acyl dehydratase
VTEPVTLEHYRSLLGTRLGSSPWVTVTQELIDRFAGCTRDEQFIHVDPAKAAKSPFGGTIAHGFLTLSLLSHLAEQAVPAISGAVMSINYGFNAVRFLSPVPSSGAIRGHFKLNEFAERTSGQWQSVLDVTVELRDKERPALVAEWILLTIMPA